MLEHVPQKWEPVLRKRTCSNKEVERDDDSKKSHPALGNCGLAILVVAVFAGNDRRFARAATVAGGLTTRWIFEIQRSFVQRIRRSPIFTTKLPGSVSTSIHSPDWSPDLA